MTATTQGQTMQGKAAQGLVEQAQHVAALLGSLGEDDFAGPAGLVPAPWSPAPTVGGVLARLLIRVGELLAALSTSSSARPVPLGDYFLGDGITRHGNDDLAAELVTHESGRSLANLFRDQLVDVQLLIDGPGLPPVVPVSRGQALRTVDLFRAATIELLLVADDLDTALPDRGLAWSRTAMATGIRALAEVIAHRHPGRSIELRVPPFAAVQCGRGDDPTHTRGTPPNVVEVDPRTFLRLTHGRTRFAEGTADGRIQASGTRSDLSAWFPVLSP